MLRDFRLAVRTLLRSPAFTVAAVLCLALAIGANTAIFSVVDAVLLRPLPFPAPERLVAVWELRTSAPDKPNVVAPADYLDWRAQSRAFGELAAFVDGHAALTGMGEAAELPVQLTTANFFRTLGVGPALGRTYSAAEDAPRTARVAVLSHAAWQRRFGGDPAAVGRVITLGGEPATIVGVMPAGFGLPGSTPEVWRPLALDPAVDYRLTSGRYLNVVGRLAPGATVTQADAELRTIAGRLAEAHPEFNRGWTVTALPLYDQVVGGSRRLLLVLAGVVAFVLLIACANVANLSLARAAARRREITVRAALGASRWQVMRGLLAESVVLSLAGGALGLLLAVWGTAALVAAAPAFLPRAQEIGIDARTLAFTAALALGTGLLFGLVPALHAARADLHDDLKEGARGSTGRRTRGALVAAQVALSLVLLIGAGLMLRSFVRLSRVDPGFDADGVLTARVSLPASRYPTDPAQAAFYTRLLPRIRALPGVRAASAINWIPLGGLGSATGFWVEGRPIPRPGEELGTDVRSVDPDYFRTMGIPIVRGEPFTERDGAAVRKAVVVNETLARTLFPNEDPIGQRLRMLWGDTLTGEIVAVAGDVRHAGLDSVPKPMIYWAQAQLPYAAMTLVVRGAGDPMRLAGLVRGELRALDPEVPLADVKPMADYLGASVAARRFTLLLLAAFAVVALVLAAVGIAGVIGNMVVQRTREIGVRMALGAEQRDVLRMVLGQGMRLAGAGIVLGLAGALALTRVLRSLLYGTSPTDVLTFAAVALLLAAIAGAAAYLPARRAARVDPLVALRSE